MPFQASAWSLLSQPMQLGLVWHAAAVTAAALDGSSSDGARMCSALSLAARVRIARAKENSP